MSHPTRCPIGHTDGIEIRYTPGTDIAHVEFWYPRSEGHPTTLQVGLMDVRAADDIRIRYDFQRDGWSIQQASIFEWEADDKVMDEDWQEVAFIQAWARERQPPGPPEKATLDTRKSGS